MVAIKTAPKKHVSSKGGSKGFARSNKPSGMSGWLWVPAGSAMPSFRGQGMMAAPFMAKGKSKGKVVMDKTKEKLRKFDASKKVWVGGMSKTTTWGKLAKHFRDSDLKPAVVDVNEKKGTGVVCFKNEDDVSTAVAVLNGTELDGSTIEVDVWTKTEKPPKEEGDEDKPKKKKQPKKLGIHKMQLSVKKPVSKVAEKLKKIDPSLKVWVGGLGEKTTFKELSKHFEEQFAKPHLVDILAKGGRAVVTYENVDDVASAVAIVNGSELNGNILEVDVWTKPEKKEKVKKEKED
jgi:RNA recognition motif-containing protein